MPFPVNFTVASLCFVQTGPVALEMCYAVVAVNIILLSYIRVWLDGVQELLRKQVAKPYHQGRSGNQFVRWQSLVENRLSRQIASMCPASAIRCQCDCAANLLSGYMHPSGVQEDLRRGKTLSPSWPDCEGTLFDPGSLFFPTCLFTIALPLSNQRKAYLWCIRNLSLLDCVWVKAQDKWKRDNSKCFCEWF